MNKTVLVAVGGNSLIRAGQRGTLEEQRANARATAAQMAELVALGCSLVVTHGNGPQVGAQLLRTEAGSSQTYTQPLDVCVAMTQGEIGYLIQNALHDELNRRGFRLPVVTIITQVLVDRSDPAFSLPLKPIGPFYHEWEATDKSEELGWQMKEDASRGYRRVVPSPEPAAIVEIEAIRKCVENGIIVVTAGGGGIPVAYEDGALNGVEAVVDKDLISALLANELGIEEMIISTDVDFVCRNYAAPNRAPIRKMTLSEAESYLSEFASGSMRPKIDSAIRFIKRGGNRVHITSPTHLIDAITGNFGTTIERGKGGDET